MKYGFLLLLVCIGSLLIVLSVQTFPQPLSSTQLSEEQLKQIAQAVTVKIVSQNTWGSGILMHQQGEMYAVLTNEHVLTPGLEDSYIIETLDRQTYPAQAISTVNFQGNDLALLTFRRSKITYSVASLGDSSQLKESDEVFASGFSLTSKKFRFICGQIKLLLSEPFKGGYQIGYTNPIENGMSGGPLLNRQGQVIGINGRQAYPLWGNPYVFEDGIVPTLTRQRQMKQLSWAIPLETALPFIKRTAIDRTNKSN